MRVTQVGNIALEWDGKWNCRWTLDKTDIPPKYDNSERGEEFFLMNCPTCFTICIRKKNSIIKIEEPQGYYD